MLPRLIDKEADTDSAAAQLGHRSKEITKKHYIVKPALAPDSSDILEQLGDREAAAPPNNMIMGGAGQRSRYAGWPAPPGVPRNEPDRH